MTPEIHTPISGEELAHVFDDQPVEVNLGTFGIEDWVAIAIFWLMALAVFLQFFTRYVLNDSFAWTEEIAIYCLIGVVFVGSAMCVRLTRHIHVDFLYRYLPGGPGRILATVVGLVRIVFFAYAGWLFYKYASIISDERMTTVDLPKSIVFYTVIAAFAMMTVRAIQVFVQDLRRGYSPLEKPEAFDGSEA
ncbi:TRAP transporter small permease [Prosthecomicrobium sp. N25]|uniref:TRAP transporter small permease n=1 Tax=Prosthecomicrobium sp. N25 TaxID=3129254 RepID=UPI0030777745